MASLRYVILRHEGISEPHFDLMFEESDGGTLMTWRSERWPIDRPTALAKLRNHRRDYLEYEGPLSGHRGWVRCVESGTYRSRPQWDDPCVHDLWLNEPTTHHLWLLMPPDHDWAIEPAE